jgi:hypothetical protein
MDVDVTQTMTQKARKVGNIRIHIQRPTGIEIVNIEDIPNYREGQDFGGWHRVGLSDVRLGPKSSIATSSEALL